MALKKKKFSEIPTDAVVLSEEDAIKYQLDIIKGWKNKSETWILDYGHTILASLSALSAMYINNHYRHKFRLLNYGRISSYLPVVVIPTLATGIFHQQFVLTNVLLEKSCSVCLELRAAMCQAMISTVFPTILAPSAAIPYAIRYNTYSVPLITKQPYEVFKLLKKHTKPIGNILLGIFAVQGLIASIITMREMDAVQQIHKRLDDLEERLEEEYGSKM